MNYSKQNYELVKQCLSKHTNSTFGPAFDVSKLPEYVSTRTYPQLTFLQCADRTGRCDLDNQCDVLLEVTSEKPFSFQMGICEIATSTSISENNHVLKLGQGIPVSRYFCNEICVHGEPGQEFTSKVEIITDGTIRTLTCWKIDHRIDPSLQEGERKEWVHNINGKSWKMENYQMIQIE